MSLKRAIFASAHPAPTDVKPCFRVPVANGFGLTTINGRARSSSVRPGCELQILRSLVKLCLHARLHPLCDESGATCDVRSVPAQERSEERRVGKECR